MNNVTVFILHISSIKQSYKDVFFLIKINYLQNDNIPPTLTAHEVIPRVINLVIKCKCQIYILLYQQCYALIQHPGLPLEIKPAGFCFGFLQYRLTIFFYSFLEQELSNLSVLTFTMPVRLAFIVREGTIQATEGKKSPTLLPSCGPYTGAPLAGSLWRNHPLTDWI